MSKHQNLNTFTQSHPILTNLLISFSTLFILLLCMEVTFFALDYMQNKDHRINITTSANLYQQDQLLAAKPRPNIEVEVTKKVGNNILYNVTYAIDEHHRRITSTSNADITSHFILFFGGSFTFGEGVGQDETLPSYVSHLSSGYKPYNYGFLGYGPQQMLAKLQSDEITEEINGPDGILVYVFIDHHINRAVGTMFIYRMAMGGEYPYYVIDADGRLSKNGDFTSGRPVSTLVYRLLGNSQTLQYFDLDLPIINDNHIRTTVKIIEESRNTFAEKFNSDKFYVLFYPANSYLAPSLMPYLDEAHVRYIDYSDLIVSSEDGMWIPNDGHPTAKAHRIVAEHLVKDLRIDGN